MITPTMTFREVNLLARAEKKDYLCSYVDGIEYPSASIVKDDNRIRIVFIGLNSETCPVDITWEGVGMITKPSGLISVDGKPFLLYRCFIHRKTYRTN